MDKAVFERIEGAISNIERYKRLVLEVNLLEAEMMDTGIEEGFDEEEMEEFFTEIKQQQEVE